MAKDVDLSSKEWRDLVFEGKNKDFGAYEMRAGSPKRHNWAMIAVVIFIVALFGISFAVDRIFTEEEAAPDENVEQVSATVDTSEAEDEMLEEEEEIPYVEPEIEEVLQEEVLNTEKVTEIAIVPDDQVTEEVKSQDELQQSETAVGTVNEDRGVDDIINAQTHQDAVVVDEIKPAPPVDDNKVFDSVEQDPEYPGGLGELQKYVATHLRYPSVPQENGIQGRVVVQFVVTKTGSIGQVRVVRKVDPDLDAEAVRVVKSLPKFVPGKMNGHPVNVWFTLPVVFKLQGV